MAKILGMIGGIGPESTIDYYRSLFAQNRAQRPNGSQPLIVINSIDLDRARGFVEAKQLSELVEYLVVEIGRLKAAGADIGLLAANTPHIVFDDLAPRSPIPLISIVEANCEHARRSGLKRVGLLGTRYTMQAPFYPEVFGRSHIDVFTPGDEEQSYIHEKYFAELVPGIFKDETRDQLTEIILQMKNRTAVEAVILGGTELPLILRGDEAAGVPLLDTTQIHVRAALARLYQLDSQVPAE
jgi:aspartate racemase